MKTSYKIVDRKKLLEILQPKRSVGKSIAFTNGCFDILHIGHVSYLEAARKNDRVLVVGLNSDASVRRIKGKSRPIFNQKQRALVLAALACVDYVVIFNEDTPAKLIEALKPDVLIKGADWKGKIVVGAQIVRDHGGKVEFIKFIPNASTTRIIHELTKS